MQEKEVQKPQRKIIVIICCIIFILIIGVSIVIWKYGNRISLYFMVKSDEMIAIELPVLENEQGTKLEYQWTELGYLENYSDLRKAVDNELKITNQGNGGKNGVIYADLEGNWTNNSTLFYAFSNKKFVENYWKNTEVTHKLIEAVAKNYVDVETDKDAMYALVNAYWNILEDSEPNYFNGGCAVTRAEFLASVYRACTPVKLLEASEEFINCVDAEKENTNTIYASQVEEYSYLTTENESLNEKTFNGSITVAEAVYTMAKMYYNNEFNELTGKESVSYPNCKLGGDLIGDLKYVDGKTAESGEVKYWESYELSYAVQNQDKGLPTDLFKAMVIADRHDLLSDSDKVEWSSALTKKGLIELIVNVYLDKGTVTSVDRGKAEGEAVSNNSLTPEEEAVVGTEIGQEEEEVDYSWLTLTFENEKIVLSDELLEALYGFEFFEGATKKQIENYFNKDYKFFSTVTSEDLYGLLTYETHFEGGTLAEVSKKQSNNSGASNTNNEQGQQGSTPQGGSSDSGSLEDAFKDADMHGVVIDNRKIDSTPGEGGLPDGMIIIGH